MKKSRIHPEIKKQISEELETTYQTVTMSLDFVFNSEKSKKIRERAQELLLQEVESLNEVNNQ